MSFPVFSVTVCGYPRTVHSIGQGLMILFISYLLQIQTVNDKQNFVTIVNFLR